MTTSSDTCAIQTADGPIRGYINKSEEGIYYKFKKIPYAKPPLGQLRFRPPIPATSWTEEIDCTQDAPIPFTFSKEGREGSEDCLYIELSTKNIKPDKPSPVMFWIGTYLFTHTIDLCLDPTLLNDQGVIFVRCGFRLGPFGFLSINEFTAPGNCGLKDIVMALKWVQKNIEKFGGDPENVTIFGSSTGGSMAHLLMLSPMATGLFHKCIIQSASALNNWSLVKSPSQPVMELAEKLGIEKTNKIEVVEELRSIPATEIMQAFEDLQKELAKIDSRDVFQACFRPCIEEDFEGLPAFLTKSPLLILKSGSFNKVPLIIGSNNIEGSILHHLNNDYYADFEKYNKNVCLLVPKSLSSHHDTTLSKSIGEKLVNFYFGHKKKLTEKTKTQYLQLISDYYFLYYIHKTVRLHNEFAPDSSIFYYIVNCAGEWNVPKSFDFFNTLGHSTEIPYIFRIKSPEDLTHICCGSRESIVTRSRVVKMWTNFAKYGHPTPDEQDPLLQINWDPIENTKKLNYLSIGTELTKGRNPFHERIQFWEELHNEYSLLRILVYFNDIGVQW